MNLSHRFFGLIGAFCLFALVASCGDDEEVDREPLIIGEWVLASQQVSNVQANIGGSPIGIPQDFIKGFVDTLKIIPENSEITFNQDRTYSIKAPQQTTDLTGTWELSDDQSTITLSGLEAAEALLGSSSLAFVIQTISNTDFSMLTSVPEITLPNLPTIGTVNASGDYQLVLKK